MGGGAGKGKGGKGGGKMRKPVDSTDEDDVDHTKPEILQGLVLARASELPQPEKDQHFLRMFGQSDRQIQDTNTDEGSIPQVLMLMNGQAQSVLRNPKSLVLATAKLSGDPPTDEEDLHATACAVYAVLLGATGRGLASYWRTPAAFSAPTHDPWGLRTAAPLRARSSFGHQPPR